jgi:hypothetical protein
VCDETAPAYCDQVFMCDPELARDWYGTPEACRIADGVVCRHYAAVPDVSASSAQSWASCNRALAARTCEQERFGGAPDACRVMAGRRQVGEPCTTFNQCATSFCLFRFDPITYQVTDPCGTCAPAPGVGDACDDINGCDFGLVCVDGSRCVRPAAEGAACDSGQYASCQGDLCCIEARCQRPLGPGAACADNDYCQDQLRCVNHRCGEPRSAGDRCSPGDRACATGLGCIDMQCSRAKPEGDACEYEEECASGACLDIVTPGMRVCPPSYTDPVRAELGESCSLEATPPDGGVERRCQQSAYCDPTTRRCVLRMAPGESCSGEDECMITLACRSGRCQDQPEPTCGR